MITVTQSNIKVKTSLRNGDESEESYLHFLLQVISPEVSVSNILEL